MVKLVRTDTTLDLSQGARVVMNQDCCGGLYSGTYLHGGPLTWIWIIYCISLTEVCCLPSLNHTQPERSLKGGQLVLDACDLVLRSCLTILTAFKWYHTIIDTEDSRTVTAKVVYRAEWAFIIANIFLKLWFFELMWYFETSVEKLQSRYINVPTKYIEMLENTE